MDAKIVVAKEKYGELEVLDASKARADYFSRIGAKVRARVGARRGGRRHPHSGAQEGALEALDAAMKLGMSSGARIDLALHKLRVALFHRDIALARARVEEAKESVPPGWPPSLPQARECAPARRS